MLSENTGDLGGQAQDAGGVAAEHCVPDGASEAEVVELGQAPFGGDERVVTAPYELIRQADL